MAAHLKTAPTRRLALICSLAIACSLSGLGCSNPSSPGAGGGGQVSSGADRAQQATIREANLSDLGAPLLLQELRLKVFRYDVVGLPDHKATLWVEAWKHGKLDHNLSEARWYIPKQGGRFGGHVQFSIWDGDAVNSTKSRWSWIVEEADGGTSSSQKWVDDPLEKVSIQDSSWGKVRQWSVSPGEAATVLILRGSRTSLPGEMTRNGKPVPHDLEQEKKLDVAIFLRARFDPIPDSVPREGPQSGTSSEIPPPSSE